MPDMLKPETELWHQNSLMCKHSQINFDINVINLFLFPFSFPSLRRNMIFLLFNLDGDAKKFLIKRYYSLIAYH